jgi:hypothetical protein
VVEGWSEPFGARLRCCHVALAVRQSLASRDATTICAAATRHHQETLNSHIRSSRAMSARPTVPRCKLRCRSSSYVIRAVSPNQVVSVPRSSLVYGST